jgi:septal ring factor EnvC (AmiA/AmiB activator)
MSRRLLLGLLLVAGSAAALPDSEVAEAPALPSIASADPLPTVPEEIERSLAAIERAERSLKKELDQLAVQSEKLRVRTIARGRAYVRLARAGLLPVGAGFEALVDHASKLERMHRALERDLGAERALIRQRIAIGKQLDALRVKRGPLEVQAQAMTEARTALMAAQDRRLAFERAFESAGDSAHTAVYGAGVGPAGPSDADSDFARLKGRLPMPLTGRSEVRAGQRADGPGLEMRAPRGTPVRAVAAGRIAFADLYADYGRTVIVDHGDQHYTVSANLDEISVRVGDDVSTGTRLGAVGDVGRGAMLYFEIRVGSENVDPSDWFGI